MEKSNNQRVDETMTKAEIKDEIRHFMDSNEFKAKVTKIVVDRLKNEKELEDKVVDITKNVMTQLYKTLWVKRGFWQSQLKNTKS
jgi:hypothetical protein